MLFPFCGDVLFTVCLSESLSEASDAFWPASHRDPIHSLVNEARPQAACFQPGSVRHAHSDHQLRIRLIPSRTICVSEPSVLQCKDIGIVRVVVVLRVVVLAFVPHRGHITVRVARPSRWRNYQKHEKQKHAMSMFWTPEVAHGVVQGGKPPKTIRPTNDLKT